MDVPLRRWDGEGMEDGLLNMGILGQRKVWKEGIVSRTIVQM
jgi:hypothetical protein